MNLRTIAVVLSADATSLRTQMAMAGQTVDNFDKKVGSSSAGMGKWATAAKVGVAAGALAIAVAMGTAVGAAVKFEERMRNVNSISHLSERAFAAQGRQVLEMSKTFPQSANVLAEGLYDIASSGFQGAAGMEVLAASAMAASAGMSDTATAARAVTAALNAYGLGASQAESVGNILFQGVNVGVMTFEELANTIGNVVGTAAAAKVNLTDLTAGLATMTLSGISASEAGTSMNRVLQGLIDPSDSLAAAFNALGYESGAQALEVDGLYVVMEKLRHATGGNIEQLLRYFPEIRGARGALALMSAEGENYRKTQEAMNAAQEKGGAMARTFSEQMKSTSKQVELVKNNVMAFAITTGTTLLPYVQDGIKEIRNLTSAFIDAARAGRDRLQPFLDNIRPIFENLTEILGFLGRAAGPVAAAIAGIAAVGVIEALNLLATTVEKVTGFFAEHQEVVAAIAAFYGVGLATQILVAGGAFDVLTIKAYTATTAMMSTKVIPAIQAVTAAVYGLSAAFATQGIAGGAAAITAMINPFVLLGVAVAGVAATFVMINQHEQKLRKWGSEGVKEWMDGFDISTAKFSEVQMKYADTFKALEIVHEKEKALRADRSAADKLMSGLGFDEAEGLKQQQKELEATQKGLQGYIDVVKTVAHQTGMTWDEAAKAVQEQGYKIEDLTSNTVKGQEKQSKAIRDTVKAREEHIAKTEYELTAAGATQQELSRLANLTGEEFEAEAGRIMEAANAATEFASKVGEAWAEQQDVVSALGQEVGVTGGQILSWYDKMVGDGQKFSENIRKAIEMGYDPSLIARTIEAGPAQAGPLLQEMVDNQSQHFIDRVNQSEQALQEINAKAVELARLTNRAMNAETDVMARDLQKAMELSTIIMSTGGQTTMKALTDQLEIGADEVTRIANEYGISLGAALNPIRSATGLAPIATRAGVAQEIKAEGGYIDPAVWGDTNADSVPAWVMPGEVVIKKKSVQQIGLEKLLYANDTGRLPEVGPPAHYAAGGQVRGSNWRNMPLTNAMAPLMGAFPNGLIGDQNQDYRVSDEEWTAWLNFQQKGAAGLSGFQFNYTNPYQHRRPHERGYNWRTMPGGATRAEMDVFRNGFIGDLNQNGGIEAEEWWAWNVFKNEMAKQGAAGPGNFQRMLDNPYGFAAGGLVGASNGAARSAGVSAANAYRTGGVTGGKLPGPPNFPNGTMGDTSEASAAQTYLKAVAWQMAQEAALSALSGGGFARGAGAGGRPGAYTPGMLASKANIARIFGITNVGGYANRNIAGTGTKSAHALWRAFDFMVGLGNVGTGNAIANHLIGNAQAYGLKGLIWNDRKNFGGGWQPYGHPGGRRDPTSQHRDHVHAEYYRNGGRVRRGTFDTGGWLMPGVTVAENWTGQPERIVGPQESHTVMPRIEANVLVNVWIGNTQIRDIVRSEISVEQGKRDRRDRSMAGA